MGIVPNLPLTCPRVSLDIASPNRRIHCLPIELMLLYGRLEKRERVHIIHTRQNRHLPPCRQPKDLLLS